MSGLVPFPSLRYQLRSPGLVTLSTPNAAWNVSHLDLMYVFTKGAFICCPCLSSSNPTLGSLVEEFSLM